MTKYEIKDGMGIIPEGTSIIQSEAFMNCDELRKVVIPKSVKYINPLAFFGCTNLSEIILPDSVHSIEYKEGVFSITDVKPFPSQITNLVDKGCGVQLQEESWHHWD